MSGNIEKMVTQLATPVNYRLPIGDEHLAMNAYLGRALTLTYSGAIHCVACGTKTKKSFSQGYCYRCMTRLAQCDMCILKPETCHYHLGTCREPQWGEQHCMIPHYVYLANSSSLKVGITRTTQVPTRWIDQGATQALPILKVQTRYQSGLLEVALRQFVSDRTHWQAMLKGPAADIDLTVHRDQLLQQIEGDIEAVNDQFGAEVVETIEAPVVQIEYPVLHYPDKIRSFNLDKNPQAGGVLQGIKGQYLIFDSGVINLRKYTGYHLCVGAD
ncbi:MAG: DUF2797 domain-containing protein [bacterium]|nr:DUF2797 domain-containing protein [bacterium]